MKEFEVFQQIQETASRNEKIEILKRNDSPNLRKLLSLTYNKFITYRIKQIEFPSTYNEVQPDITQDLEELLLLLAKHETGSTAAKNMVRNLMKRCTEEGASWVAKIVTRDLKAGIDESTINAAFPKLIPTFDVMLAQPIYKGGKTPKNLWPTLKYPVLVEEKLDGLRCIAVCKDGKVTFFSREGHEFDERGVIAAEILKLRPETDFVLDGEILAKRFNPDNKTFLKCKDGNWVYEGGKALIRAESTTSDEVREYLGYYCWDLLPIETFFEQKKSAPLSDRKLELAALFERQEKSFNNLILLPNALANNEAEVKELFHRVRTKGGEKYSVLNSKGKEVEYRLNPGEGVMVKLLDSEYEFKRSSKLLKVKEFFTMDLRIVGAYEGEGKYQGMLGGVEMASDCGTIKTDCGTGFDDAQRYEMWVEHLCGRLVGLIGEVSGQEVTADGSLRFPVWQRLRDDKTCTNVEG